MARTIIETEGLTKIYGDVVAVRDLNLQVEEGEVFGFLGPNGAGKTTTILMLMGLTEPSSGKARVAGYELPRQGLQVRRIAGYMPENMGFYEDMTAYHNLLFTAKLNGLQRSEADRRIGELLQLVGLKEVAETKVGRFSRGMKQRLGIADVLIKEPKVAFLDEPTAGVDPEGVRLILELIKKLSEERGTSILLSSHLLYQVQRICKRVGIIAKGKLVAQGTIERLGQEALRGSELKIEVKVDGDGGLKLLEELRALPSVREVIKEGEGITIACSEDIRPLVAQKVVGSGMRLLELRLRDYTLEDIYARYFKEGNY